MKIVVLLQRALDAHFVSDWIVISMPILDVARLPLGTVWHPMVMATILALRIKLGFHLGSMPRLSYGSGYWVFHTSTCYIAAQRDHTIVHEASTTVLQYLL